MNNLRLLLVMLMFCAMLSLSCGGGSAGGSNPNPNPNPTPGPPDNVAPTVSLTTPTGGAAVTGISTLTATASDNIGVAGVQFLYDGKPLGSEILFPPYSVAWNTTTSVNGSHMIAVQARDAAGNRASTAPISVNVNNAGPPVVSVTFTLQPAQRFQTWQAWMGSSPGPYYPTPNGYQIPPAALLNAALDDVVFDLGINGLRMHAQGIFAEPINDNSDPFSINPAGFDFSSPRTAPDGSISDPVLNMQMIILPFRQRVLARNEPFVSYATQRFTYVSIPLHWHNPEEMAEYSEAYIGWLRANFNFTPNYYSVFNEPEPEAFSTGELLNDIIAIGRRFQVRNYNVKIQTTETLGPNPLTLQGILADALALPYIGMISYHSYDYQSALKPSSFSSRNGIRSLAQQYNLPVAMSEVCCQGWDATYLNQGLRVVRDIFWNVTEANAGIWAQFALVYTCDQPGCTVPNEQYVNLDTDFSRSYKMPNYYALRQYSKYIRPGYVRTGLTCAGCTSDSTIGLQQKAVAFQSPGGNYVVVILNDKDAATRFAVSGLPAGTYEITGVDPGHTSGMAFSPLTITAGQNLAVNFAGRAIITLVQR